MMTREHVAAVLERGRPLMQADGGDIELVALDGNTATVRITGACETCPTAFHLSVEAAQGGTAGAGTPAGHPGELVMTPRFGPELMNGPGGVRPGDATIEDWLQLIRAEYLEAPGLRLTRREVQRLWGLDAVMCDALLAALVDVRFLKCIRHEAYVRV